MEYELYVCTYSAKLFLYPSELFFTELSNTEANVKAAQIEDSLGSHSQKVIPERR